MSPSRRSLLLAATFLALATHVTPERKLRAQPPGRGPVYSYPQQRNEPFNPTVTPEQARDAFRRADQVKGNANGAPTRLPPGFEELVPGLKRHFQQQFPDLDPGVAEPAVRRMLGSPELQSLDPAQADLLLRQAFQNPAVQQKVREMARTVQSSAGKTTGGFNPNGPSPDSSRPGNGPPFDGKNRPRPPFDGAGQPPSEPPPDGPAPLIPKDNKGIPPKFIPNDGPTTTNNPKVRPDPNVDPVPKFDPNLKVQPNPNTESNPKIGPSDVAEPKPIENSRTGRQPGPMPMDLQHPDMPPGKQPPIKTDLGEGFRPPGSADPNENPADAARRKRREAAAALWERSVGPLDETPVVKRALFDLVEGSDDLKDSDGNNFFDSITKEAGDGASLADWVNKSATGDSWKPDFSWARFDGGGSSSSSSSSSWWSRNFSRSGSSSSSSSSSSGRSSGGSFGGFDLGGSGGSLGALLWVLLFAAVLIGGLLLWKFLYFRDPKATRSEFDLGGLGPWPVDPRGIATRDDLVKAFEYLSVMICGPAARMWTHSTIAAALADLATTHSETAMILARLYELARYAPLDEPLTRGEIEEARLLVCQLAGVSYP